MDKWIILAVGILTMFGLLGIASATRVNQGNYEEFIKQLIFIVVGCGVMIGTALINLTSIDDTLKENFKNIANRFGDVDKILCTSP